MEPLDPAPWVLVWIVSKDVIYCLYARMYIFLKESYLLSQWKFENYFRKISSVAWVCKATCQRLPVPRVKLHPHQLHLLFELLLGFVFKALLVVVLYPGHTADQPDERPHARVGQLWAAQTQASHLVLQIFLVPQGQNGANQFLLTKSTSTFFSCIIFNTDSTCVIKSSNLLLFRPGRNNIHRCYWFRWSLVLLAW